MRSSPKARPKICGDDLNWMIGGPQGSGVDSGANVFARACSFGGFNVYGKREYHSNITGMHSYFHNRVSKKQIGAGVERIDLLCAFDAETVVRHMLEVSPCGCIILDPSSLEAKIDTIPTLHYSFLSELDKTLSAKGISSRTLGLVLSGLNKKVYSLPYDLILTQVSEETGGEKLSKLAKMKNVLAIGASFGLLGYDYALVELAVKKIFSAKAKLLEQNLLGLRKAYGYARKDFTGSGLVLKAGKPKKGTIFLQGTQAVALGKLAGGCRFQTYYPITPAGDESDYLERNGLLEMQDGSKGNIIVMQTEDEIAAINMASGAALAGARSATSTSGPGFSLMVEGIGWAGMNEVPVVISYYQRGGPATGLPTRHGQDDLRFAIHAAHGDFPRIVLCSGDIEECFYDAAMAFNYAERYQMPVIHLTDKALASNSMSLKRLDAKKVRIDRGLLLSRAGKDYRRFELTKSGISPRIALGTPGAVFWNTGDEHDEFGHICEEPDNRIRMLEKRMRKLKIAEKEILMKDRAVLYGDKDAKNIVVSWGSPKGAILEAMGMLKEEGHRLAFLQVRMPHPLPKEFIADVLGRAKKKIMVEGNYSAQLAGIIAEKTGIGMDYFVLKYTGRPMAVDEVYNALKLALEGRAPARQVLSSGA